MTIDQVNSQLRNKRPAAKQAPVASKPDVASIRQRIADVRKQVGIAFEQAQRLGASKLAAQIRTLSQQLITLEADLMRISGVERRLVRMITRFP
jgi:hypothetical protein